MSEEIITQTLLPASPAVPGRPLITVTEKAARRIMDLVKRKAGVEELPAYGIRLRVVGGGCNGMQYKMDVEDKSRPSDKIFDGPLNVRLFVDIKSLMYLKGTELDVNPNPLNGTFEFKNPNVKSSCGCGMSFQA